MFVFGIVLGALSASERTGAQPTATVQSNAPAAGSAADSAKMYVDKGRTLFKVGRLEEALKAFETASEIDPTNEEAINGQINVCLDLNRTNDAIQLVDKWIALKPDDPARWQLKGTIEAAVGRYADALKISDKLIQIQPNEARHYISRGQVLMGLGRIDDALKALEKATALDPKSPDAWNTKAGVLALMKKLDEAIACCNKAVALAPKQGYYVYNRACVYALRGDRSKTLADLKKAVALDPGFKAWARKDQNLMELYNDKEFKKLTE